MACGLSSNGEALLQVLLQSKLGTLLSGKCSPKIYDFRVIETGAGPCHRPYKVGTKGKCFRVALPI